MGRSKPSSHDPGRDGKDRPTYTVKAWIELQRTPGSLGLRRSRARTVVSPSRDEELVVALVLQDVREDLLAKYPEAFVPGGTVSIAILNDQAQDWIEECTSCGEWMPTPNMDTHYRLHMAGWTLPPEAPRPGGRRIAWNTSTSNTRKWGGRVSCPDCGRPMRRDSLRRHVQRKHSGAKTEVKQRVWNPVTLHERRWGAMVPCPHCKKKMRKDSLPRHIQRRHSTT